MNIETVRISERGRENLINLKRKTGIRNWNVLCRWAFCVSISDKTPPKKIEIDSYSTVEMTWKIFGGTYEGIYTALLKQRLINDGIDLNEENLREQFKLHLHRGIQFLAYDKSINSIQDLISLSLKN